MITREEGWSLLCEYNKEPFHLRHGEVVEGCMRYFARQLGYLVRLIPCIIMTAEQAAESALLPLSGKAPA